MKRVKDFENNQSQMRNRQELRHTSVVKTTASRKISSFTFWSVRVDDGRLCPFHLYDAFSIAVSFSEYKKANHDINVKFYQKQK